MNRSLPAAAIAFALLLAGCSSGTGAPAVSPPSPAPASSSSSPLPAQHAISGTEGRVTYSVTLRPGQCHARASGTLPDQACTPGSYDPKVTQATIRSTICVPGWTKKVRPPVSQTNYAKFSVAYPAYSIPNKAVSELDHLVPLELGGSSDITNLWPEAGAIPNAKDPVENDLRADVCAGELTLGAARAAVTADWKTVP